MFFSRGRLPEFVLFLLAGAAQAESLSLAEAERIALENEPGQAALLERAGALREQAVAAGQLPDPKLRVALANFPIESGGFSTEGMTQAQLGVRQAFPPGNSARTHRPGSATYSRRYARVGWMPGTGYRQMK